MEKTENDDYRDAKRLKSMQVDLKVIVGSDENVGGIEEFWHYSSNLAYESGFVDTVLSTRVGVHNGTIAFPDVTPKQWKRMMEILRKPHLLRLFSVDTVCELAILYDQYDFGLGIYTCDDVLMNELPLDYCRERFLHYHKREEWINIILLSQKANLRKAFGRGKNWLFDTFANALDPESGYGPERDLFLTDVQIEKLAPVLKTMELKIGKLLGFGDEQHIDVSSPLFPRLVRHEVAARGRKARKKIRRVRVSFPVDHEAAGIYVLDTRSTKTILRYRLYGSGNQKPFSLKRCPDDGCWELCSDDTALYRCKSPWEQFTHVPPFDSEWIDLTSWEPNCGLPPPLLPYIEEVQRST